MDQRSSGELDDFTKLFQDLQYILARLMDLMESLQDHASPIDFKPPFDYNLNSGRGLKSEREGPVEARRGLCKMRKNPVEIGKLEEALEEFEYHLQFLTDWSDFTRRIHFLPILDPKLKEMLTKRLGPYTPYKRLIKTALKFDKQLSYYNAFSDDYSLKTMARKTASEGLSTSVWSNVQDENEELLRRRRFKTLNRELDENRGNRCRNCEKLGRRMEDCNGPSAHSFFDN